MIRKDYIEPSLKVVRIKCQPMLAGSDKLPISEEPAEGYGAKQTTGGWFEENDVEE